MHHNTMKINHNSPHRLTVKSNECVIWQRALGQALSLASASVFTQSHLTLVPFSGHLCLPVTVTTSESHKWHSPALHLSISGPTLQGADGWGPTEEITLLSNLTKLATLHTPATGFIPLWKKHCSYLYNPGDCTAGILWISQCGIFWPRWACVAKGYFWSRQDYHSLIPCVTWGQEETWSWEHRIS